MRYTPADQLKTGMILGQDIHDASGHLLLGTQMALSEDQIANIITMGIPGVFVHDEFAGDISIRETVAPEIKQDALRLVSDFFQKSSNVEMLEQFRGDLREDSEEREIKENVQEVVSDVMENDDVMYNVMEVKTYDDYTYFHSVNVGILSGVLGAKCGLNERQLTDVVTAGFLHDVGKVFIPGDLLNAKRALTEEERIQMMEHPKKGYDFLVNNFNFNDEITRAVLEHHEWYNGWGYPDKKRGNMLGQYSRILKAADVFDAMTSKRPYHPPYLPSEVMEYVMGRTGTEFDPEIVQIMSSHLCIYPVGCEVELSDGRRGIVVENSPGLIMRPMVKLFEDGSEIDLGHDWNALNLTIVKLVM